jgi:hypothetical protein
MNATHFTVTDVDAVIYHGESLADALAIYQSRRDCYKPAGRGNVRIYQSVPMVGVA